jgi:hypothetical protein
MFDTWNVNAIAKRDSLNVNVKLNENENEIWTLNGNGTKNGSERAIL